MPRWLAFRHSGRRSGCYQLGCAATSVAQRLLVGPAVFTGPATLAELYETSRAVGPRGPHGRTVRVGRRVLSTPGKGGGTGRFRLQAVPPPFRAPYVYGNSPGLNRTAPIRTARAGGPDSPKDSWDGCSSQLVPASFRPSARDRSQCHAADYSSHTVTARKQQFLARKVTCPKERPAPGISASAPRPSTTTSTPGPSSGLTAAQRFPQRVWAIEGCNGVGRHVAHRLVADRETVVDVPAKLSAQVRVFAIGNGRKTDPVDAHSVALAALRVTESASCTGGSGAGRVGSAGRSS